MNAQELLREAKKAGCAPSLHGNWVVFKPPLPTPLLMLAVKIGSELAAEVMRQEKEKTQ